MIGVVVLLTAGVVVIVSPHVRQFIGLEPDPNIPQPIATADLSGTGPGTLVSAVTMPDFSRNLKTTQMNAARVVYRSTEGDTGQPTVVSGSVFTPTGPPPPAGWPVIALGHGTLGIDEPCGPSLSPTLLGNVDAVAKFVKAGFAVAVADYQGLGAPGVHPYLDSRTAGRNIIDAVRALKNTFPEVSGRWGAWGGSQGGGAVWGAAEQVSSYAPEMPPVGVVALAPAADVSGLVDLAVQQKLDRDQMAAIVVIVESLARLHPDLNRDDYRQGLAAEQWDVLTACSGDKVHDRDSVIARLQPGDITPRTPAAADRLRSYLKQWALPQQRLGAPMSVVFGGADEYINHAWTEAAIHQACALGGAVTWDFQPDKGHGTLDTGAQVNWLAARFAGTPVDATCGPEA
ncbi:MAG: lipase family protein [Mycobacterium sp.]